jgi:hypothetical protein
VQVLPLIDLSLELKVLHEVGPQILGIRLLALKVEEW